MADSSNVILVFIAYSAAMIVLPLFTFYAVKNLLEHEFHITGFTNTAWSVICSVIVVNLIIMSYAWRAFKQETEEESNATSENESVPAASKSDLDLKKDQ